jgi:hypothetical protein
MRLERPAAWRLRALELVLHVAVLEVLEVERRRVLHQAQAGLVAEAFREQRVDQRDGAAQHVGQHRQRELQREEPGDAVEEAELPPFAQVVRRVRRADEQHHLVDDQLADVERRDRQQRADEAQHDLRGGERRAGAPDQREERR